MSKLAEAARKATEDHTEAATQDTASDATNEATEAAVWEATDLDVWRATGATTEDVTVYAVWMSTEVVIDVVVAGR